MHFCSFSATLILQILNLSIVYFDIFLLNIHSRKENNLLENKFSAKII